jgi:hypothetical protein
MHAIGGKSLLLNTTLLILRLLPPLQPSVTKHCYKPQGDRQRSISIYSISIYTGAPYRNTASSTSFDQV